MSRSTLPTLTDANLERVLRLSAGPHLDVPLWWRCGYNGGDDTALRMMVLDSDFFHWGCADAEPIGDDDVDLLAAALSDAAVAAPDAEFLDGFLLYCARRNQMRPQGAYYPALHHDLWPLFDDCGPEREVDFGNPKPRPTERPEPRAPRPTDPDTPVLPAPGVPMATAPLSIVDIRRVLEAFSFDYTDSVRWIVDEADRLRLFIVTFGALREDEVGCEAAEVTPDNVESLLAAMAEARATRYHRMVDEYVTTAFVAAERGLTPSQASVARRQEFEAMVAEVTAETAGEKSA